MVLYSRFQWSMFVEVVRCSVFFLLFWSEVVTNSLGEGFSSSVYFNGYSRLEIHREMLQDVLRMESFFAALQGTDLEDKIIVDFGCGTGILSLFAHRFTKRSQIYCVEASEMAVTAEEIFRKNNATNRVTILRNSTDIDFEIDIIVSEWMGYFLVSEWFMVEALITLRDEWLKPDGVMFPDLVEMIVAPYSDPQWYRENEEWVLNDIYGFDFSPLQSLLPSPYPLRGYFPGRTYEPQIACSLDMKAISKLWECSRSNMKWRNVEEHHGFLFWFDVHFYGSDSAKMITLSTSPSEGVQHWGQVFWPKSSSAPLNCRKMILMFSVSTVKFDNLPAHNVDMKYICDGKEERLSAQGLTADSFYVDSSLTRRGDIALSKGRSVQALPRNSVFKTQRLQRMMENGSSISGEFGEKLKHGGVRHFDLDDNIKEVTDDYEEFTKFDHFQFRKDDEKLERRSGSDEF